ncbi:MAG: alanine--tRNA ligase [Eubacterium sp.]|jgi:alanyl-tRNA synthetase|nr:alanine--tRNA ligase [Eubacterium sp.]
MKWTGLNELRESYLEFFESKGHLRLPSAPLVPKGDNSILLINAGMTPLKKYFQGTEKPPCNRVTSCQKCIRTPDIENVGITARHGTYFEMLGNFSFGDYFKNEAIAWAWEYFTEVLEIPTDKLWVTIYEEDNEAGNIWANEIGVPRERIVKMGKADNFWEHGSGPCGPCSEIHYDNGQEKSCGKPDCKLGCDCDRYVELWNLVFTQFDSDGKGNYTALAAKNIDTGMGLDRLACVLQGVDNMFEVDTTQSIIKKISAVIGREYKEDPKSDVSIRIIADHLRASIFMAGDGIRPSNEGRGYVMRRLIRRAARHGRILGAEEPFLSGICDMVIEVNGRAYPELAEKKEYIKKVIQNEEGSFNKTISNGLKILNGYTDCLTDGGILDGESVFKLHDTYGFPLDLTREILAEKGFGLDEEKFRQLMQLQKDAARQNQSFKGGWDEVINNEFSKFNTEFVGFESLSAEAKIMTFVKEGLAFESVSEGDEALVLIDKTPFYAESGGQVGDGGELLNGDNIFVVYDCKKTVGDNSVLRGYVKRGIFYTGDSVLALVDRKKRLATMRNHTCAHLLHAALREVLGEHVHQAGSYVDSQRCRFDFSHFNPLTADEIFEVERIVNEKILDGIDIIVKEMPLEQARKKGATALFGEKYGDVVRVVDIPGFSMEFCGGTHLDNTAKAGLFKIVSETSVASGVRRIEAISGTLVLDALNSAKQTIAESAAALKLANSADLVLKCETVMKEMSLKNQELDKLQRKLGSSGLAGNLKSESINGFEVVTAELSETEGGSLRKISDEIKTETDNYVMLLAGLSGNKVNLLCKCGKTAVLKGAHAGNIVKEVAAVAGGKGGGKPDSAMAGINDISKVGEALTALSGIVEKI